MKQILALCLCVAAGCAAEPVRVESGMPVTLRPGQSAQAAGSLLRFGFEGVTRDSRCPKGEQCIVAGEAVARIWVQRGDGPRVMHELHTAGPAADGVATTDPGVRLLHVEPYPVTRRAIGPGDYAVTLVPGANASDR